MAGPDDRKTREYTPTLEAAAPAMGAIAAPTKLGRYALLELLGAGGMGVVYAAYDPNLDRKVALKLLRPAAEGISPEAWQGRLLREARAMARLSHPNVVHVHDAGEVAGRVYVAMEFVDGQSLRGWLGTDPAWQDRLRVLREAGRGLAEAHRAGLVHRDFKPENVLVGRDGRARVTDFGLAAVLEPALDPGGSAPVRRSTTGGGALIGTPEYLAPEQLLGARSDPRADQFSYAVTAYEALFGSSPYPGDNPAQRALAAQRGALNAPAEGSRAPGWLRQALARALSADPARRYPSMDALLAAIDRPASGRRRASLPIALGAALVLSVVAFAGWSYQRHATLCTPPARFAGIWDAEARQRLRAAFLGTSADGAGALFDRLQPQLDRYVEGWRSTHRALCEAGRLQGTIPEPVLQERLRCLERRAGELEAMTQLFGAPDRSVLLNAPQAVEELDPPAACAEVLPIEELAAPVAPELQRTLGAAIAEAQALQRAGRYTGALARAREAAARGREAGALRLAAEAGLVECETAGLMEDYQGAPDGGCFDAALDAERAGDRELAVFAWTELVTMVTNAGQHEDARRWLKIARAMGARLGPGHHEAQARLLNAEAFTAFGAGEYRRAAELWEQDLKLREERLPAQSWDRAATLMNAGVAWMRSGDYAKARTMIERALALHRAILRDDHPELAAGLSRLAMAELGTGDLQPARELFTQAIALRRRADGPDTDVSLELSNLAGIDEERGDYPAALAGYTEAQRLRENALGADHPFVAASLTGRATTLLALGRVGEAAPLAERALAIRAAKYGAHHPLTVEAQWTVAGVRLAAGQKAQGLALLRGVTAALEQSYGADHAMTLSARISLARALLETGQRAEAVRVAEAAVTALSAKAYRPLYLPRAETVLAQGLWESGAHTRALEVARDAEARFQAFALPTQRNWVELKKLLAASAIR